MRPKQCVGGLYLTAADSIVIIKKIFRQSPIAENQKGLCKFSARFLAFFNKISTVQKIVLSSSREQGNFRGLEASRPSTSKCVLEDSTSVFFRLSGKVLITLASRTFFSGVFRIDFVQFRKIIIKFRGYHFAGNIKISHLSYSRPMSL